MWLGYAFLSAALLGCYDVFKKVALRRNDVIPVLFLNTFFCSLIFLVPVLLSQFNVLRSDHLFYVPAEGWHVHRYILLKSCIVLSSWSFGYLGMKHLPLTLVGPINATRPVMVLVGAMLFFGERLNGWQWAGVWLTILSYLLLRRSGKREGIDFRHNRWIFCVVLAALLGAVSGLYDKYLLAPVADGGVGLDRMVVQSYFNFYQCVMMSFACVFFSSRAKLISTLRTSLLPVVLVSVFLSMADLAYFYALSIDGALISVVSMVRRGSVVVSFLIAAYIFHERNLRSKAIDLVLMLLGLACLWIGTK